VDLPGPVLTIRNLSKTFVGQRALSQVSMDVMPGEVHCLVGENGSGKSTLIKCLSGFHNPDPGAEIHVGGERIPLPIPASKTSHYGLCFVHQDLGIVPSLSVLENFCMGRGYATGPIGNIRFRAEAERVRRLMASFGHGDVPVRELVRRLPSSVKAIVAIVRALSESEPYGKVLVLDEPTTALPQEEVGHLFDAIRTALSRGVGMIYVTHRLDEVFRIGDRVTVLRDGVKVATVPVANLTKGELAELIVGRSVDAYYPQVEPLVTEDIVLRVEGLSSNQVDGVSFTVKRGEIVGITGLLGSGCTEVGRLLFGASKRHSGKVNFKGRDVEYRSPGEAVRDGVAMITEDRVGNGSFPRMSVRENITVTDLKRFGTLLGLSGRAELQEADRLVREFGVKPTDCGRRFNTLSGGNQQKAIVAKWMRLTPDLLICDEPTAGVDVGAKAAIYTLIEQAAVRGAGVLLVSSETKDLEHLCHKVLVLRRGRIAGCLAGEGLTEERLLRMVDES